MFLTGLALKSTVVLAAAWLITMLLRGRSAALRHLIWTAASVAVLVLPLLSVSLPVLHLPVSESIAAPPLFQISAAAPSLPLQAPAPPAPSGPRSTPATALNWTLLAISIWGAGTLFALARMVSAWLAVERLRRGAKPFVDGGFCGALTKVLEPGQTVEILESKTGSMPMTFGIRRTAILLPADAVEWSEERRRVVLMHELAHIRRGDVATNLLGRLAVIAYWWNPLAWFAWREFVKERELAADDLVLNAGTPPGDYARHLLEVARSMQIVPAAGWAAVAMVRRSQLEIRLRAILDSTVNRTAAGRASALLTVLLALLLMAPLAAVRGQETKVVAVPADLAATISAARSQKNFEMLEGAANSAVAAREFDAAEKLLAAAVAIRGEIAGNPSREYGLGLLNLAALQQRRNENEFVGTYAKAVQMLGEDPKAGPALLHLGAAALFKKNYPQATAYFQHAQQIDPASAAMALMWSAVVLEAQKNNDEADALFRRAVAQLDPKSPGASTILKVYANFLHAQGRDEEATVLEARSGTAPATPSELPAGVYRIGGGVQAPKVLEKKEPEYTDEARAAKLTGTEVVSVQIGADGLAHNIQVLRGLGLGLDENGIDTVRQWRFQPAMKDGQPVTVIATIEINWRLL